METTNNGALGEDRSRSEVPARFTIQREGLRHVSEGLATTCGLALCAGLANAACSKGRDDDVVTFNNVRDASADLLNDARTFVTENCRRGPTECARSSGHIRVTNTSSHHLDDDLAGTWLANFESVEYLSFVASENDALHGFPQR